MVFVAPAPLDRSQPQLPAVVRQIRQSNPPPPQRDTMPSPLVASTADVRLTKHSTLMVETLIHDADEMFAHEPEFAVTPIALLVSPPPRRPVTPRVGEAT